MGATKKKTPVKKAATKKKTAAKKQADQPWHNVSRLSAEAVAPSRGLRQQQQRYAPLKTEVARLQPCIAPTRTIVYRFFTQRHGKTSLEGLPQNRIKHRTHESTTYCTIKWTR